MRLCFVKLSTLVYFQLNNIYLFARLALCGIENEYLFNGMAMAFLQADYTWELPLILFHKLLLFQTLNLISFLA